MLRSRSNTLVSVRRVTEHQRWARDGGRRRRMALLATRQKAELAGWVQQRSSVVDAAAGQTGVHPEGQRETAPARDSGDRGPGVAGGRASTRWNRSGRRGSSRGPMDFGRAVAATTRSQAIFSTCKGPRPTRVWVLDADLAAAFDRIDHDHLLDQLGHVPRTGT